MKVNFILSRLDGNQVGFKSASIFSTHVKEKFPLKFYAGEANKLLSIIKYTNNEVQVRYFKSTDSNFTVLWGQQYMEFIDPILKELDTHKPVLYSLADKRMVKYMDFALQVPSRTGDEIFFTHFLKEIRDEFDIFWFSRRDGYSCEDLAILYSTSNWYNFGVESPKEQTEEAKELLVFLHESYYNNGVPGYLDHRKVEETVKYSGLFINGHDYFSEKVLVNQGKMFARSKNKIFGGQVVEQDADLDFPPNEFDSKEKNILPYLQKGQISLRE